jgi:predicted DNA-binding protein (UPF0251 family)/predicted Fe-Mo cluster-binding NifX family protein
MPRPRKWRKVCCLPERNRFGPLGPAGDAEGIVNMTVDEYESIRLIDLEGFTQEECAGHMNVARTTVQGIYDGARKKLAESLVSGKVLWIEGGEYKLCDGMGAACGGRGCHRRRCGRGCINDNEYIRKTEGETMIIAVASEGTHIAEHFGHCGNFNLYHIHDKRIVRSESVANPGHKPGFLPNFLHEKGVHVIIAGGMGSGAVDIFNEKNIEVILGASGDATAAVESYLQGSLKSTDSVCHAHQHQGECDR